MKEFIMEGVREHAEEYPVSLRVTEKGRIGIYAMNEGGYNCTVVDLLDLLEWVKVHGVPSVELLKEIECGTGDDE